jgi:hypothetical protein
MAGARQIAAESASPARALARSSRAVSNSLIDAVDIGVAGSSRFELRDTARDRRGDTAADRPWARTRGLMW